MNTSRIINFLNPGAHLPLNDFYSTQPWAYQFPKPSIEELQLAEFPAELAYRIQRIKEEAGERILAVAPQYRQNNAALELYTAEKVQAIKDAINAIRIASDEAESAVSSMTVLSNVIDFKW